MAIGQFTQLPSLRYLDGCWILRGNAQPKQAELELQDSPGVGLMIGVHISDLRRNGEKV